MNDDRQSITEEIKYVSFKLGNYKIRFNKKIFKYTLIIGVIIIIGLPYINLKIPTHYITSFQNSKEAKWRLYLFNLFLDYFDYF